MSPHARHLCRTLAIAFVVSAAALLAAAVSASAYVTASGTAAVRASVTTLPAPTIARATAGGGTVALSWSTVAAPASGSVSYYVSRDNGAASSACPSAASPTAATSCTDTGVSTGTHRYTVTAVWRSWTSTSTTTSVTVTIGAAAQLVFTTQPGGSSPTGGLAFPTQPVVTARDANGATVTDYSGTVTLSILRGGASGATLSGCVGTLANGVTRFAGCEIDKSSGSAYYLHASDGALGGDSASFTVSTGAAAQLLFTTQPGGGATGGSAFPTQPVVTVADAGGNTVTSSSSTVSLSIVTNTGTAGATLSNCSGSRKNGVTTFDSCEIDKAGSGYQLHASTFGGLRGDSTTFDVAVGTVSQIAFTTQSGGGATVRTAFPTQPVVTATDAGGNTVTSYNRTVSVSIVSGTGARNAVLSGCRGTLANGVTTFAGCQIDKVGFDYQLRASDGSRSDTTDAFAVNAGPATQLVVTTQPGGGATGGLAFPTQPVVTARDVDGNTATSYAGTIALTVGSGPGALSGCSGSLRSGVTTFSGCELDRNGSYVLHASDGTLATDTTSFSVSVGAAAQLLFTIQPAGARANTAFATQPALTAYDAGGNVVTGYSTTITLSIKSGTGAFNASLSSCSQNHSNGVTTFSGCKIDKTGTGYVLHAVDRNALIVDSSPFTVS